MLPLFKRITPQIGLWLVILVACVALQWLNFKLTMRFDRPAIADAQWYRFITANLVHLNITHLWLNMMGLAIVAVFFSRYLSVWRWLFVFVFSSLGVTLGIYWLNPALFYYVGMSGVLHGLFAVGAIKEIQRFPISGWLLLILLIAKLLWEQFNGAMPGSESMIKGRVMVDAHLYGFIAGLLAYLLSGKLLGRKAGS